MNGTRPKRRSDTVCYKEIDGDDDFEQKNRLKTNRKKSKPLSSDQEEERNVKIGRSNASSDHQDSSPSETEEDSSTSHSGQGDVDSVHASSESTEDEMESVETAQQEKMIVILDKILGQETHTLERWEKICFSMNTTIVRNGTLLRKNESSLKNKDEEQQRFLVKWKNKSFLHITWETEKDIIANEPKQAKSKIRRYHQKEEMKSLSYRGDDDDYFNSDYLQVERIIGIKKRKNCVETSGKKQVGDHGKRLFLIKWLSLPYDQCTWEDESDIDNDEALRMYEKRNKKPVEVEKSSGKRDVKKFRVYSEENLPEFKSSTLELRNYQMEGVNWLLFNWYSKRNSILADEMGLGKTIQATAFVNHLVTVEKIPGPFLVIAPLSTLHHWQREFEQWTHLNALLYHGSLEARRMIKDYEFFYSVVDSKPCSSSGSRPRSSTPSQFYKFNVLITSPEMCLAADYKEIQKIQWQTLIIDEAHRLKNKSSRLTDTLSQFHFDSMILLTGTPLQNNLEELWTLLNILDKQRFPSYDSFSESFGQIKESDQVDKLHKELRPYLLRRLKGDVEKSIVPKEESIIEVELTMLQKQYYRAIYEKNVSFLQRGGKNNGPSLMNILMELRKCCNHPYLINGVEAMEVAMLDDPNPEIPHFHETLVSASGKLVLLDKLLPRLEENGHRVLIFSQFRTMLDILEDYLRGRKFTYERIDGNITGNCRQAAIDRYCAKDSKSFVMLLSTRAGGVGINLTAADTCIIYDSDWNPQNDLQAQARCHRIGQKNTVKVYRLLTSKTYEMHMFHQASLKLGLDHAVLGRMTDMNNGLSKDHVESLLKYGAYDIFNDDNGEEASKQFCESSIDQILSRSKTIDHNSNPENAGLSMFSKATFVSSAQDNIPVDDPDFWSKVVGLKEEEVVVKAESPKQRRCTTKVKRYLEASESEDDSQYLIEQTVKDEKGPLHPGICKRVTENLMVFGYGRWDAIHEGKLKVWTDSLIQSYCRGVIAHHVVAFSEKCAILKVESEMSEKKKNKEQQQQQHAQQQQQEQQEQEQQDSVSIACSRYIDHVMDSFSVCRQVIADASKSSSTLSCGKKEDLSTTTDKDPSLFSIRDVYVHPSIVERESMETIRRVAYARLSQLDDLGKITVFVERYHPSKLVEYAHAFEKYLNDLEGGSSFEEYSTLDIQSLHELGVLTVDYDRRPYEEWTPVQDDLRLLVGVYRYGWMKGTNTLKRINEDPDFSFGKVTWSSCAVMNRRVRLLISLWMTNVNSSSYQKEAQSRQEVKNALSIVSSSQLHLSTKQTSGTINKWTTHDQQLLTQLITFAGIPVQEDRDQSMISWNYFYKHPFMGGRFEVEELQNQAKLIVDIAKKCKKDDQLFTPPPSPPPPPPPLGETVMSSVIAKRVCFRVDLFHKLRSGILEKEDFGSILQSEMEAMQVNFSVPRFWMFPEMDIELLKQLESYGYYQMDRILAHPTFSTVEWGNFDKKTWVVDRIEALFPALRIPDTPLLDDIQVD